MHGRLKVKSSAEQLEAKRKEREVELKAFQAAKQSIFSKKENGKLDEEVLFLTKELLKQNPDFYTLWNIRVQIFLKMKSEVFEDEFQKLCSDGLFLTQTCLMKNPKSYGAWHHRGWLMDIMPHPDWDMELQLCNKFLSMDERNFHCWDYRRFICKRTSVKPEDELLFTTDQIEKNFSNYSAWHYRTTLLPIVHPGQESKSVKEEVLQKEYDLVQNAAFTDPYDQSVWFYHRWLLGRGEKPLEVTLLYVSKTLSSVIIVMSSPVKVGETCNLNLQINGSEEDVEWKPAGNFPYASTVWQCNLAPAVFSREGKIEITAILTKDQEHSCISCSIDGDKALHYNKSHRKSEFVSELSAATKDVLERELDSCEKLCMLEPNNKWSLFTCVLMMKALDSQMYLETIYQYLDNLMEVDPLRTQYYKDLKSKFIIESIIESSSLDLKGLSLADRGLTSLHHFDHFVHIKKVDLSGNDLKNVYPLYLLLCVEHLILDGNRLTDCRDLKDLTSLKTLSLKKNYIKLLDDLVPLVSCPNLENLFIEGNPVVNDLEFITKVKDLLKLKQLDYGSENVINNTL